MIIMRKIQRRIEKKEHGFIVNIMAILPLFLFQTCHDSQEGYLSTLTYNMGTLKPE